MRGELIQLNKKELKRLVVIQKVIDGHLTINDASRILGLSSRQVKRLKKGVLELGPQYLAHGNRGRTPKHAVSEDISNKVINIAFSLYQGFNFHHIRDLLFLEHGIDLSVSTVRRILIPAGFKSPKNRRRPKPHRSRPRRARMGELVQIDASPFRWFGPDKPCVSLLAAIDDATGLVLAAVFRPSEDLTGYLTLVYQMAKNYGLPLTIYSDRHTIFMSPKQDKLSIEEELAGKTTPLTNFGQCLCDLGIRQSFARSPQAKGRIERLWQTLQDRLTKEMSLAGVDSIDAANMFLPTFLKRFNARFAVNPFDPNPAFLPCPDEDSLLLSLSVRSQRKADSGSTISFRRTKYQLVDTNGYVLPLKKGSSVTIHEELSGVLRAVYKDKVYKLQTPKASSLPEIQSIDSLPKQNGAEPHVTRRPAPDHPWKRWNPDYLRSNNSKSNDLNSRVTFSQNYYGDIFSER
jgi:transposase